MTGAVTPGGEFRPTASSRFSSMGRPAPEWDVARVQGRPDDGRSHRVRRVRREASVSMTVRARVQ